MTLFVLAPNMHWLETKVSDITDGDAFRKALVDAGYGGPHPELIISDEILDVNEEGFDEVIEKPKVPFPRSPSDLLPEISEYVVVSAKTLNNPFVRYGGRERLASVESLRRAGFKFSPDFPICKIKLQIYWRHVNTFILDGSQGAEFTSTSKEGMSKTEQKKISASLGVKYKVLDLKISAELQRSVTISSEKTVSQKYSYKVNPGSKDRAHIWQLVQRITFVTEEGAEFSWRGRISKRMPHPIPIQPPLISMRARFEGGPAEQKTSIYHSAVYSFNHEGKPIDHEGKPI